MIKIMKEIIGILIDIVEYIRYEIYIVRHKKELKEYVGGKGVEGDKKELKEYVGGKGVEGGEWREWREWREEYKGGVRDKEKEIR